MNQQKLIEILVNTGVYDQIQVLDNWQEIVEKIVNGVIKESENLCQELAELYSGINSQNSWFFDAKKDAFLQVKKELSGKFRKD